MQHKYSLAHLSALMLPPPALVEAAANAGFDYVGLRVNRVTSDEPLYALASDPQLLRETKRCLELTGLQVLDVELARIGPDQDAAQLSPLLEVAAELGAHDVIGQLPGGNRERAMEQFGLLCDLAKPLGIFVNLEFPWWTETPNLDSAASVLRQADRTNAAILIDTLHFARSSSSLAQLAKLPRQWFRYAQVCDGPAVAPTTREGIIHEARCERLFPGEGSLNVTETLSHMPDDIPYALEIPRTSLSRLLGDAEYVRVALEACRRYLDHDHTRHAATA